MSEEKEIANEASDESLRESLEEAFNVESTSVEQSETNLNDQQNERKKSADLPPIEAPHSWSAEEKAKFQTLPRDLQEYVAKREGERDKAFFQKSEEVAKVRRNLAEIERAIEPHLEKFALLGMQPAQVINQLIAAQNFLDKDPISGLQYIAQSYGIDLTKLGQQTPKVDPYLSRLEQQLSDMRGYLSMQHDAQQRNYISGIQNEVVGFAEEKDSGGNLLRPHFGELEDDIVPMVSYLKQTNPNLSNREILDAAYQKAVWANPLVREKMLKQEETRKAQEIKAKTLAAKRAGATIKGSPGSNGQMAQADTLRGQLEAAFDNSY